MASNMNEEVRDEEEVGKTEKPRSKVGFLFICYFYFYLLFWFCFIINILFVCLFLEIGFPNVALAVLELAL